MSVTASHETDRRAAARSKSLLRASLVFNNRLSILDCVVRNVSATGARLQMSNGHLAPDEFDLHVPQRQEKRRARAVWRGDDGLGISFIEPSEAPRRPENTSDRALALENEELRRAVRDLKRRLAQAESAADGSY